MEPHIGMKFWQFDPNHRVYKRDGTGRAVGGPVWRAHWVPTYIVGETRVSWLVGMEWLVNHPRMKTLAARVPKKGWPHGFALDEAEIDRRAWVVEYSPKLAEQVGRCRHYDTLKAIADLLDGQHATPAAAE